MVNPPSEWPTTTGSLAGPIAWSTTSAYRVVPGRPILAREIHGERPVSASFEDRDQPLPAPRSMPCAVDERERRHLRVRVARRVGVGQARSPVWATSARPLSRAVASGVFLDKAVHSQSPP